jgi:hypothetical protein
MKGIESKGFGPVFLYRKGTDLWSPTVGDLETETFKLCTGDPNSKDTALPIVSSDRVVSWAAYASWKACYH